MNTPFTMHSTMKQVAALAGEEPSDHPRTACAAATAIVLTAETFMDHDQQRTLQAAVPTLKNSRRPTALRNRLEFMTERAIRKYALEALLAAGSNAAAAAIRDEPSITKAAALAEQFGDNLANALPADIKNPQDSRKLSAARACRTAARAVGNLEDKDMTSHVHAAQNTAYTLLEWARATKQDPAAETVTLLEDMVKVRFR